MNASAFILAAGLGTRLRPLTDTMPKALVPVAGKPLLQHLIERLKHAGFTRIVVNIHHFGEQIIDFLHANDNFGVDIRISDERGMLLETGGAVRKAMPLFKTSRPVLVHNVDILHNLDVAEFYLRNAQAADATLLVSQRTTTRYLYADARQQLVGWQNIKTNEIKGSIADATPFAFSGIHLISPTLLSQMTTWSERFSIIDFYLHSCTTHSVRLDCHPDLRLLDVGKIDTLSAAAEFLANN